MIIVLLLSQLEVSIVVRPCKQWVLLECLLALLLLIILVVVHLV